MDRVGEGSEVIITPEAEAFLAQHHPHLRPFVVSAAGILGAYFPDSSEKIFIVAQTSLPWDEIEGRLHELDTGWWFENQRQGEFRIQLSAEQI